MDFEEINLPDPFAFVTPEILRQACRVLGIALVVQWFLPWGFGPAIFSWNIIDAGATFSMVWPLLSGVGLIALGFLPEDTLKPGFTLSITAGLGLLGLLSFTSPGAGFINMFLTMVIPPMLSFLGAVGLLAVLLGLLLWMRAGHSLLAWAMILGGIVFMGLWLLVPVEGQMPLIGMFRVLGQSQVNFVWRLIYMLLHLSFVGFAALVVLKVVLPRETADSRWLRPLFWLGLAIPVASTALQGLAGIFDSGWMLLVALHILVMVASYLAVALLAGVFLLGSFSEGGIKDLF